MALQNVGDIIFVGLNGLWHGQKTLNTFYYKVQSIVGGPTNSTFSAALHAAFNAATKLYQRFRECCPTQYVLDHVDFQTVWPVKIVRNTYALGVAGLAGQASSTANMASVMVRKGDVANKKNRGTLHVPMSNLDVGMANGIIGAALQASQVNLGTEMIATYAAGGLGAVFPVLWSPKTPTVSQAILQAFGETTARIMRRRTVGVGK